MESFSFYILSSLALVIVIEGLVYAFFPDAVKRMMNVALAMSPEHLRMIGASAATLGLLSLWLISLVF